MANNPPPYSDITGISRTVMKDNAQESITNYNGNARPGEIVVNLTNNDVYIGNISGNLALISAGSSSGNNVPAGGAGEIQFNAGGNLFGASANLTFATNTLTTVNISTGNITTANILDAGTGNIFVTGNLLPSDGYNLGLPSLPWANAYFGPDSITILEENGNISNAVVISNDLGNTIISAGGFIIQGNGIPVFRVAALTGQVYSNAETIIANVNNSSNATSGSLQTAGGAGIAKNLYVGGNITVSGISNLSSNANVKITGGSNGQSLTTDGAGNLSWTTVSATTPTYGQFWSNVTQTVASPNTEYRFAFNNSDGNNNVTLGTGVSNSRVIINQTGLYNIQFSAQIDKDPVGSSTSSAYIWFKKNGTAVPDSAGFSTVDDRLQTVLSWNILANVANVGDYYEIAYAADKTYVSFPAIAGNVTVGYPASPSIILTVTPVGA